MPPAGKAGGRHEAILLVDDEAPLREFTAAVLRSQGYRVLQARGATEALEVWKWHGARIGLLLTDMALEDMFGLELAARPCRERPKLAVVCVSGQAENITLDTLAAQAQPGARSGDYVVLTVGGPGHRDPPELLDLIVDPFVTTEALGMGTGLGLSMVLGIVKAHGAFLTVRSQPGQDTAFRLFFPAEREAAELLPPFAVPVAPHGYGETILVIDDEKTIREMTRQFLEHHGYRVLLASDGTSGLDLYREHAADIDLVLTDMMMPGLQISALCTALWDINPAAKVLLMSGLIGPENREQVSALGAVAFRQKSR